MAKNVKINGVTYSSVPEVDIPLADGSANAKFYSTENDTAAAGDVLTGKTVHSAAGAVTGTMANNGGTNIKLTTADGATIPAGYYDGTGKAVVDTDEAAKLVSTNIKAGVTILGVTGATAVVDTSDATAAAGEIANGKTAYVNGGLVTGTMTAATVSQDSDTKILSIS